jgi:ketosteroid isomerase-like protein
MNGVVLAIHRADEERYRAMLDGDIHALERLLADDLSYTHSSAHTESKAEYLASLASGRVKYLDVQRDAVQARVYGDIAVLNGKVTLRAIVDGISRVLDNRFLSVWKRDAGGGWQMSAWASTPIPPRP